MLTVPTCQDTRRDWDSCQSTFQTGNSVQSLPCRTEGEQDFVRPGEGKRVVFENHENLFSEHPSYSVLDFSTRISQSKQYRSKGHWNLILVRRAEWGTRGMDGRKGSCDNCYNFIRYGSGQIFSQVAAWIIPPEHVQRKCYRW